MHACHCWTLQLPFADSRYEENQFSQNLIDLMLGNVLKKKMLKSLRVSLDDWSLERYGLISWNLLTERAVGGFYQYSNFSCLEKERKRGEKNVHVILSLDLGLQILLSWSILGVKQSLDSWSCVVSWETSSRYLSLLWYWEKRWPSLDYHE